MVPSLDNSKEDPPDVQADKDGFDVADIPPSGTIHVQSRLRGDHFDDSKEVLSVRTASFGDRRRRPFFRLERTEQS